MSSEPAPSGIVSGTSIAAPKFWRNEPLLLSLYFLTGFIWCLQTVLAHVYSKTLYDCTFFTFQESFFDLIHHQPLYPGHSNNVFKYSPTFALFFAPFAALPAGAGMFLWIAVNFMAFFSAIWFLPLRRLDRILMLWVSLFDLMTALRDWQSNGLVVAAILGAFLCLSKGWPEAAALCVIAGLNIKIYGAAGAVFFLFYPHKFRFLAGLGVIGLTAFLLPLAVISWSELLAQYRGWYEILHHDASGYVKLSVMGLIRRCTGWTPPVPATEIIALAAMLLPLARVHLYDQPVFRLRLAASILLGVVIFNHMADRQAFAIAAAGAVLWYVLSKRDYFRTALFLSIVVFSSGHVLHPLAIKVVPFAIIWIILQVELWRQRREETVPAGLVENW